MAAIAAPGKKKQGQGGRATVMMRGERRERSNLLYGTYDPDSRRKSCRPSWIGRRTSRDVDPGIRWYIKAATSPDADMPGSTG